MIARVVAIAAALTVALVLPSVLAVNVPYTNCGNSSDVFTISSVSSNEWPPQKGSNVSATLTGTLSESVTGGTVSLEVFVDILGGFHKVADQTDPICSLESCPVAAGAFSVDRSAELPSFVPSGNYKVQVSGAVQDGKPLACAELTFKLS